MLHQLEIFCTKNYQMCIVTYYNKVSFSAFPKQLKWSCHAIYVIQQMWHVS